MRTAGYVVLHLTLALLVAGVSSAEPFETPNEVDPNWTPWVGCWQLTLETFDYEDERPESEVFVCLSPTSDGDGVGVSTWADGSVVRTERLVADGSKLPVEESGCQGWRSAVWSQDGHRLFLQSELDCDSGTPRRVSGTSLFVSRSSWVDIQLVKSGDRRELVIRRYRSADDEAMAAAGLDELSADASMSSAARARAAGSLDIEDVIEAGHRTESELLEALLMESGSTPYVNSQSLMRLADADIPAPIIDLMVALSYPDHFEVRSRDEMEVGGYGYGGGGLAGYDDPYGGLYDPYGYWYPFYFAPFGYYAYSSAYAPYGGYYLWSATEADKPPDSGGRVVKGHGYTRVWPKESTGRPRGGTSSGGGWFTSGDGSSGGEASSGGYSSGSGSRSTGRTAKPKKNE